MLTDWTLTSSTPWALQPVGGAMAVGDVATIIYTRTHNYTRTVHQRDEDGKLILGGDENPIEVDETSEEAETRTTRHQRAVFDGKAQTNSKWHANMKREITADLANLNKAETTGVDITNLVK